MPNQLGYLPVDTVSYRLCLLIFKANAAATIWPLTANQPGLRIIALIRPFRNKFMGATLRTEKKLRTASDGL